MARSSGVVGNDNIVHLKPVELGRDFGTQVELKSGVSPTDQVILNPSDSLEEGDKVQIKN